MNKVVIQKRFCGPPESGNGGYVCGIVANFSRPVSEVTLRKPPPLNREMEIQTDGEKVSLMDGEELVAYSKPGKVEFTAPAPPSFADAREASKSYYGFDPEAHIFPTCFVCGPLRKYGDGMNVFAGRTSHDDLYAAPWIPHSSLADENGQVKNEFIWSALDCPGAFAIMGDRSVEIVLGRMTAEVRKRVRADEKCIVVAWPKGHDGRKYFSGTAVYNSQEELCAVAHAIWIDIGD